MSAPTRQDVHVLSEHIQIDTEYGTRHHFVIEVSDRGAVAYPANRGGHIEVRLPIQDSIVSLPSFELCIERLLAWIANGRDES